MGKGLITVIGRNIGLAMTGMTSGLMRVRQSIDNNIAKLSQDDAKFFLINISPSEKELRFIKELFGEGKMKAHLKAHANGVIDAYATNFKRAGVKGKEGLIYYGKLEHARYYTYKDLEVRKGKATKGDRKLGEQMHLQVIVSRKDASNSIKLSPLNNSKGRNAARSQKVGQFDRVAFKQASESLFDQMFGYDRDIKESFKYANALKDGTYEQRAVLKEQQWEENALRSKIDQNVNRGLLDALLTNQEHISENLPFELRRKKKEKDKTQLVTTLDKTYAMEI